MTNLAVLLTVNNRKSKTLACLKRMVFLLRDSKFKFDVYLVDDGSTDGTSEAISSKYPEVKIIKGNGSLYWNRGMHLAWQTAAQGNYDFYLWINNDIILYPNAVETILNDYNTLDKKSILAGTFESKNGDVAYGGYLLNKDKVRITPNGRSQKCDMFNGNLVLVPDEVFQIVGNLDKVFPHAQGDFDYGLRAKKMGVQSYITSKIVGTCERHENFPKWCDPNVNLKDRLKAFRTPLGGRPVSTFIFEKRHYGISTACFHFCTIHLRLLFPTYWIKEKKAVI